MSKEILVKKRDGSTEPLNIEKIHKIISWAIDGLEDVSLSDIEMNAKINFIDGITSREIHRIVIESAVNLISIETPDYQYVASRLLNYSLRKDVWGGKNPPKLYDFVKRNVKSGWYDKDLLNWYSEKEFNKLDELIDHTRDYLFTYAGLQQMCDKYLIKSNVDNIIYETPQFLFIVAGMTAFHNYPENKRIKLIKRFYNHTSKFKLNLATPVLSKLRTPDKSYASCCLIPFEDTKESIDAMIQSVSAATYNSYGIGVDFSAMRAIKSSVNKGKIEHPGIIPFMKMVESGVKAWSQGSRGGGGTMNLPIFHYEIQDYVQLKSTTTGTTENRIPKLDYVVVLSNLFIQRFIDNKDFTLFSPSECKDLFDAYGTSKFNDLYVQYENRTDLKQKKVINAREFFNLWINEYTETGRIYSLNIDNVNQNSAWNEKIGMTNLCVEINQNINPQRFINDPDGEIGVCILGALNWNNITSDKDFEDCCDIIVRFLNEIIDNQEYFSNCAKKFATEKRSLGIGITNLAAFLAENGLKYDDSKAIDLVDSWMEKQQYYLLKSSNEIAKEKGHPCINYKSSSYSRGILPIDRYKKNVDEIVKRQPSQDWETLRKNIDTYGLYNCTLSTIMPCESSSVTQNATNGIEPIRSLITYKTSKRGSIKLVQPNIKKLRDKYDFAFGRKNNIGYLNICIALQKWVDMAMSVNLYYNPEFYSDLKIPNSQVLKELFYFYKYGGKTTYYLNTNDMNSHFEKQPVIEESACSLNGGGCAL